MEYELVFQEADKDAFESHVKLYLSNGWILQGGVVLTYNPDKREYVFAQAMVFPDIECECSREAP